MIEGYQNNYYYLTVVQLSVLGGLKYCHPCCGTDTSPSLMLLMSPSSADKSCEKDQNSPLKTTICLEVK